MKISSRIRTGRVAAMARSSLASPFTVVTMPALSVGWTAATVDWAAAAAGTPAQRKAATAKTLVRTMIVSLPLAGLEWAMAPASRRESKRGARRTLWVKHGKSLAG